MPRTKRSHEIRYYLGIDGGQSSTTALIADAEGCIIGAGRSGPCNHVSGPEANAKFLAVIGDCLDQAFRQAGLLSTQEFHAACLGFSGGAQDKSVLVRQLVRSVRLKITHDAEIALIGATGGEAGIVVIAGTGSMAFGRDQNGRSARAGGWGYIYGDEGGAFDLTRRGLRAALQMEEGWGPATALRELLLQATGAESANALLHRFYVEKDRQPIAALAPIVTNAAENGDPVALEIIDAAVRALSWFAGGVHKHLFAPSDSVPIAYVGGVFTSPVLRQAFQARIRADLRCEAMFPRLSPAAGAVLEALRMDGNTSTLSHLPNLEK